MLLKEEIRRLNAWYLHEISRITKKLEEFGMVSDNDRQKRGTFVLLRNKQSFLEGCLAKLQMQRG